jgi:hypothetical protein
MAFDNTSRMQAIFDRENRLGKKESVTNKDTKKRISVVIMQFFFENNFLAMLFSGARLRKNYAMEM